YPDRGPFLRSGTWPSKGGSAMELALGVVLDASADAARTTELARQADAGGLDLVVLRGGPDTGLDPWTAAVWVAGVTDRIAIGTTGFAPPPAHETPYPSVVEKARESADLLTGRRLVDGEPWTTAPADADRAALETLAADGRTVVVPVSDAADVASLAATAVEPGDPEYLAASSTYLRGGAPGLVLRPETPEQVADALEFARAHTHVPLGVRSGGHGISGRSTNDGGVVIDVGRMNRIEVLDASRRLVRIGPGATWKQVAAALDPY